MKPHRLTRGIAIKTMLSRTDIVGTMPSALRSSGSSAVPAASDARGEPVRTRRPPTSTRAAVETLRPEDRLDRLRAARTEQAGRARAPRPHARTATRRAAGAGGRARRRRARPRCRPAGRASKLVSPSARTSAMSRPSIVAITSSLVVSAISAGPRPAAVTQDRDAVRDLEHLVEVVADEQQGHAGGAQATDHRRTPGRPRAARATTSARRGSPRGRRSTPRARWRSSVAHPHRTSAPGGERRCRCRSGAAARSALRFISSTSSRPHLPRGSLPEVEVAGHRHQRHERDLLERRADADVPGVAWRGQRDRLHRDR